MPDINKYIDRDKQTVNIDGYIAEVRNYLIKNGVPEAEAEEGSYAIAVVETNLQVVNCKWIGGLAVALALNGYNKTIQNLRKYNI